MQPQTLLQSNSATASFASHQLFPLPHFARLKCASVSPSNYHSLAVSVMSFTSLYSFCLSPSLILSHPFTLLFWLLSPPPLPFPSSPCLPLSLSLLVLFPPLLIRAICWRKTQTDLTMDRIVLCVERVVQCRSQMCICACANVWHTRTNVCRHECLL